MNRPWLKARRAEVEEWLDSKGKPDSLSASRYLLHRTICQELEKNVRGRVLEAGAGGSPFRDRLEVLSDEIVTLDLHDRYGDIDLIADIQDMKSVESSSFDVVVCTQVLEHLPNPLAAMTEMRRVLKDGGVLILSAPHLSMIHEAPYDYFRYTRYGLEYLSESAGFRIRSVQPTGGLLAFVLHPLSTAALILAYPIRPIRWLVWNLNYMLLVRLGAYLDRLIGASSLFPLDQVMVAVKPRTGSGSP